MKLSTYLEDFKRAKGETKKSIGEVMKLRKKLVKKGDYWFNFPFHVL